MALSRKTKTADRLACERAGRHVEGDLSARIMAFAASVRPNYDWRPVTKAEWDQASGDEV